MRSGKKFNPKSSQNAHDLLYNEIEEMPALQNGVYKLNSFNKINNCKKFKEEPR